MGGLVLALVSALSFGSSDFLGGRLSRRSPATSVLLVAHAAGVVVLATAVVLVRPPLPPLGSIVPAALAGAAELVAITALYRGLAQAPSRIVAPAASLAPVVALAGGAAVGDLPGPLASVALVPILVGLLLASGGEHAPSADPAPADDAGAAVDARADASPGIGARAALALGGIASLGFGAAFVCVDIAVDAAPGEPSVSAVLGVLLVSRITSLTLLSGGAVARGRPLLDRRARPAAILTGVLIVLGDAGYAGASGLVSVGIAAAITSCHSLVTVVLSALLLGERTTPLQRAGLLLCALGVAGVAAA